MSRFKITLILLSSFFVISCGGSRDLVYFSNYDKSEIITEGINTSAQEVIIQPGDILSISVSSLNPEADMPFNRSLSLAEGSESNQGYLVDSQGEIDFPILGTIEVGGFTKPALKNKFKTLLSNYLSDPIVNIKQLNFRITVLGEVSNPSTFVVPSERINIIEALGLAGDMTVYGKRDNVLLIREVEKKRSVIRLDLNDKSVLNSPYYNLAPNDIVYVEPIPSKKEQASLTRANVGIGLSLISAIGTILFVVLNN